MLILGINSSHNATACLLKDGKVVYCVSEERFTRVKNQSGLPINSIKQIFKDLKIRPDEIDQVGFSFEDMAINRGYSVLSGFTKSGSEPEKEAITSFIWKFKEWVLASIPQTRYLYPVVQSFIYKTFVFPRFKEEVLDLFEKEIKIDRNKVRFIDHHTTHAYSAYFGSPKYWEKKRLILTLDAMGDGACATVNVGQNGKIKRISTTPFGNSIGDLYAYVTRYLGMKMGEHEYKVMGLAPYANTKHVDKVYQKIRDWVSVDRITLEFKTKIFSHVFYRLLEKPFRNERFDNISGAVQKLTEEVVVKWAEYSIRKTGVKDIVCGGGVFMNVKANQKIAELPDVKSLFIFPSCGDESTSIGAAYYLYEMERAKRPTLPRSSPIEDLYLGTKFSSIEVEKELKKARYGKYQIRKLKNINKEVARLISERKIVARCSGRMEWGARALGNRSIISHPENLEGVREINEQIKSRDFWMPFAPSILSERMNKYLINPKNIKAPYMILAYETTAEGRKRLRAAIHQYDFSARPQEVIKEHNFEYHNLISEFEKISGIGAVLNTSFNLHGYPIVCSPEDALYVFENSGLEYLAVEDFLVSKKTTK